MVYLFLFNYELLRIWFGAGNIDPVSENKKIDKTYVGVRRTPSSKRTRARAHGGLSCAWRSRRSGDSGARGEFSCWPQGDRCRSPFLSPPSTTHQSHRRRAGQKEVFMYQAHKGVDFIYLGAYRDHRRAHVRKHAVDVDASLCRWKLVPSSLRRAFLFS